MKPCVQLNKKSLFPFVLIEVSVASEVERQKLDSIPSTSAPWAFDQDERRMEFNLFDIIFLYRVRVKDQK
jgi:hypothetical protein